MMSRKEYVSPIICSIPLDRLTSLTLYSESDSPDAEPVYLSNTECFYTNPIHLIAFVSQKKS